MAAFGALVILAGKVVPANINNALNINRRRRTEGKRERGGGYFPELISNIKPSLLSSIADRYPHTSNGISFRKKIPWYRLRTVSDIPRKKVLIPRHSEDYGRANSEAQIGTELLEKICFTKQLK
jgi:hypothetical protein